MSDIPAKQATPYARYTVAALCAVFCLTPMLVALNTSLKTPLEVLDVMSLPSAPRFDNYLEAWKRIGHPFLNSILISLPGAALSVVIGSISAYPLSHIRGRSGFAIYLILLAGMFVPFQVVQIPLFTLMRAIGLYNSIPGLWLVHAAYGVPICTFFMRNFFASVPRSMFEAALLDGCGHARYFVKILMPASLSGLSALFIIQTRAIWNDLLFSMTLTSSDAARPVTVALNAMTGGLQVQHGMLMAATMISITPVIIAFLLFQKAFVLGVLGGSGK